MQTMRKKASAKRAAIQDTAQDAIQGWVEVREEVSDYPPETIEALQETFDIEAGKIPAKRYHSSQELFDANYSRIRQDCGESLGHREE